ncbi:hypothetical protein TRV_05274 [Trichophyton verrucosum HKI 0517]|uniref:Cell polarity protein (Alp11) n=1 Tax=Trichophyton verrucosum (strain HKI 0517) TaxID=663202 RepID=D4DDR2_TRIVH|nr:uncharacterized protein TRV_05274 [Trichophyton verrucosum HKI 0517]EFE40007.1 hypothetical protein TRV_05274 [Trichophyton verrucosum HKI 0517]
MDPLVSPADVSVQVSVASDSPVEKPSFATERRVTPSWTVSQLKIKLETMTGIPPGSQRLMLKSPGREHQWMDGEEKAISQWGIAKGCEIEYVLTVYQIHDQRPVAARPNYSDVSTTEKFELSDSTYESLPNSVLAWKKAQKLGRFDPNATSPEDKARQQVQKDANEIKTKGEIPDDLAPIWVGIELDEPTGKNDGSVNGERYFTCPNNCGVFVKPEKVEVGDYPPLGLDLDEDMEEI